MDDPEQRAQYLCNPKYTEVRALMGFVLGVEPFSNPLTNTRLGGQARTY